VHSACVQEGQTGALMQHSHVQENNAHRFSGLFDAVNHAREDGRRLLGNYSHAATDLPMTGRHARAEYLQEHSGLPAQGNHGHEDRLGGESFFPAGQWSNCMCGQQFIARPSQGLEELLMCANCVDALDIDEAPVEEGAATAVEFQLQLLPPMLPGSFVGPLVPPMPHFNGLSAGWG
jgi:hypothetical protein